MGNATNASILSRLWRLRHGAAPQDPADLGTAFGLEMRLEELSKPLQAAPGRRQTWLQRLGLKART